MKEKESFPRRSKYIMEKYSSIASNTDERLIDAIDGYLSHTKIPGQSTQALLTDTVNLIHRYFEFKEISIGLRDFRDELYRYKICKGFRKEAVDARMGIKYTQEDMVDTRSFPSTMIGRKTQIHLSENAAYRPGEENTFNRPSMLNSKRPSLETTIEGDYIDIFMYDAKKKFVGWIELSGTRDGKFPKRETIFWLEMVASLLSVIIIERMSARIN